MGNHFMQCGSYHRWGIGRIVALTVSGVIIACVFGLAFGWLVMILWNWLMPGLFGLKLITYWQAFGIIILARLIMGSIGGHHPRHNGSPWHPHYHHHGGEGGDEWAPAGDHRNWRYYREYWKERGRKDFEEYLKGSGHGSDNDADRESGPDSH